MAGRVFIIAGSDPSGGAGLQADIKTVTALGGYAGAAVTALTVQNTLGVRAVRPVEPEFIFDQIAASLEDIGADAIKIGMVGGADAADAIARAIKAYGGDAPVVLDPVLAATSGDALASEATAEAILSDLAPLSDLITPNADEAAALTGLSVISAEEQTAAGRVLLQTGAKAALVKGGHLTGPSVRDVYVDAAGVRVFEKPRLDTPPMHGTGCTLASAIATGLAQSMAAEAAISRAIGFVRVGIVSSLRLGAGAKPLNHATDFSSDE